MSGGASEQPQPKGVIAIVTAPDGDVIASVADFDRQSYGGFKLWEAQRMRAKDAAIRRAVEAYCSDTLCKVLSGYLLQQLGEALRLKGGHKITLRAVGWSPEVTTEIER